MKNSIAVLVTIVTISWTTFAVAADDDPNLFLIKARQAEMELRGFAAAPLFDMAKGKIPYDAERATQLANNLKILTQLDMTGVWAPGHGQRQIPRQDPCVAGNLVDLSESRGSRQGLPDSA